MLACSAQLRRNPGNLANGLLTMTDRQQRRMLMELRSEQAPPHRQHVLPALHMPVQAPVSCARSNLVAQVMPLAVCALPDSAAPLWRAAAKQSFQLLAVGLNAGRAP